MSVPNERDAYRAWRYEQAMELKYAWSLKKIAREVQYLMDDLHIRVARELATTRAGQKVLKAYWGYTQKGWEAACGTDGRLKTLARRIGWNDFQKIIEVARKMQTTPEEDWLPAWKLA